jgi:beta-lactamase superfamily II metal-dependent hydrolase
MSSLYPSRPLQAPSQFHGIELDMLSLGDADCMLVTGWNFGAVQRVLIDGGNKNDAPKVKAFLAQRGVSYVDHVVCTHPHDDHAGGLVALVNDPLFAFGSFWMHLPWNHVDIPALRSALQKTTGKRVAKILYESLETQIALLEALERHRKVPLEPFAGQRIGFLTVCGPTCEFYEALVCEFTDLDRLAASEQSLIAHERQVALERIRTALQPGPDDDAALGSEPTEPENDSSVVLATNLGSDVLVFTGDAGVPAIELARNNYPVLGNCHWMQIPHHGSRRNLTEDLINWFRPQAAFVSAAGTNGHPRRKVVNAFKRLGTAVFSTHYPHGAHLWYRVGLVPARPDYRPAVQLYN